MEYFDIVDENDNVVAQASREEVYDKKHPHRIAHVFGFDKNGNMALQLRNASRSFCPLHWIPVASGHVSRGESFEQAALREMQEEVGKVTDIEPLSKDVYVKPDDGHIKILGSFKAILEPPFNFDTEEVEAIEYFTLDEVKRMIAGDDKIHPEFEFLFKKHYA